MSSLTEALDAVRSFMRTAQSAYLPATLRAPRAEIGPRLGMLTMGEKLIEYAKAQQAPEGEPLDATTLGARLMTEELGETLQAMARGDTVEMADGLADVVYVVLWTANAHGIPLGDVFDTVHAANMAKFPVCTECGGSGKSEHDAFHTRGADWACQPCGGKGRVVIRDAGGKVQKPAGWTPPNIAAVLAKATR